MTPAATRWLESFSTALARRDLDAAAALFEPAGYWRDLVAFTWNIETGEGRAAIRARLERTLAAGVSGAAAQSKDGSHGAVIGHYSKSSA